MVKKHFVALALLVAFLLAFPNSVQAQSIPPMPDDDSNPWPPAPGMYPSGMMIYPGYDGAGLTNYVVSPFLACGGGYRFEASIYSPSEYLAYRLVPPFFSYGAPYYRIRFNLVSMSDVSIPDVDTNIDIWSLEANSQVIDAISFNRLSRGVVRHVEIYDFPEEDFYEERFLQFSHIDVVLRGDEFGYFYVAYEDTHWYENGGPWWWPTRTKVFWFSEGIQVIPLASSNPEDFIVGGVIPPPPDPCTKDLDGWPNWPLGEPGVPTPVPTVEPTPTLDGGTPHPTSTPTNTPDPSIPTATPPLWATTGPPTVLPQGTATPYVVITVNSPPNAIVTPPPVATFASIDLPPWVWPTIPEPSPFPTRTPWPSSAATITPSVPVTVTVTGTPPPGGSIVVTSMPTAAPGGAVATSAPVLVQEGYLIATRWASPVNAAFDELLATDTEGGPATFSIVGVGQQVEYMVDTVVEPFQFARALVYYMPNTWPLAAAFMTVVFVVTASMVWRFSLNLIVTAFELFRRVWGMLPFT